MRCGGAFNFQCHITGSFVRLIPSMHACYFFLSFWRPLRPARVNIAWIIEILANAFQVLCICWEIKVCLCIERVWWEEFCVSLSASSTFKFLCTPLLVRLGYLLDAGALLRGKLWPIRLLVLPENRLKRYISPWSPKTNNLPRNKFLTVAFWWSSFGPRFSCSLEFSLMVARACVVSFEFSLHRTPPSFCRGNGSSLPSCYCFPTIDL